MIHQRPMECSLAALSVFNGLSQADYEAMSDLARERGARYTSGHVLREAIAIGKAIAEELGLSFPEGYRAVGILTGSAEPNYDQLAGKGIVRIAILPKRARTKWLYHVVAFENNTFTDTDGNVYKGWHAYAKGLKAIWGHQQVKLVKIFPAK